MPKLLLTFLALIGLTLSAQGHLPSTGAGPSAPAVVGGSYQGFGDVYTGGVAYWGLRAYSAATRGTAAVNVCDDTGANCADFLTDATTGALVITTRGSNNCAVSGTCRVATLYDQSGALKCSGAACNVSQATNANRPVLIPSCSNGQPCLACNSSLLTGATISPSIGIPTTVNFVARRTGVFTGFSWLLSAASANYTAGWENAVDVAAIGATSANLYVAATDASIHSIRGEFASPASGSNVYADNSAGASPGTPGTANFTGAIGICGNAAGTSEVHGNIFEIGVLNNTPSGGNNTTMVANQKSYWGF